jgi:hypothetical protein
VYAETPVGRSKGVSGGEETVLGHGCCFSNSRIARLDKFVGPKEMPRASSLQVATMDVYATRALAQKEKAAVDYLKSIGYIHPEKQARELAASTLRL